METLCPRRRLVPLVGKPCQLVRITLTIQSISPINSTFSRFIFALLNTSPKSQTVDIDFTDVFVDQVCIQLLSELLVINFLYRAQYTNINRMHYLTYGKRMRPEIGESLWVRSRVR